MALNDVRLCKRNLAHVDGHLKSNYSDYYHLNKLTKLSAGSRTIS